MHTSSLTGASFANLLVNEWIEEAMAMQAVRDMRGKCIDWCLRKLDARGRRVHHHLKRADVWKKGF